MNVLNKYRFLKNTMSWSKWVIMAFVVTGLFHKFIANDIPIIATTDKGVVLPVAQDYLYAWGIQSYNPHMNKDQYASKLRPLIPYSPYAADISQVLTPPLSGSHLLGTDKVGRDVLAGILYGTATALKVSVLSILLALIIAFIFGVVSGYYHEKPMELNLTQLMGLLIVTGLGMSYLWLELFSSRTSWALVILVFVVVMCGMYMILTYGRSWPGRVVNFPVALVTDKIIEVREAIPSIFLVLGAMAVFRENSIGNVILIIGLVAWSNLARYIRAEVMKIRNAAYVDAAYISGASTLRIIRKHILPNAVDPILSVIAFSITAAILMEATLSFLGIGMPPQEPTWGGLLSQARNTNAWWLAIYPGVCIFLVITSLNDMADHFQKRLDKRIG
jgi:peptide/nickel transport system permease protein